MNNIGLSVHGLINLKTRRSLNFMTKEIKYIGFYDIPEEGMKRVSSLAAINKMNYISDAINQAGYDVRIVSPSWASDTRVKGTFQKGRTLQINPHKKVTFCPTFTYYNKIAGYLKIILALVWLFLWLLKNVKRNEKIIVYHVQWLSLPIRMAKKIIKFHLILEVEELYQTIWMNRKIFNKWEMQLIKSADSYIPVSEQLADKFGNKVKAIVYGDYTVYKLEKNKGIQKVGIDVVYAGSIDHLRGAAMNAVLCAELLPEKYTVHILGSGDENIIKELLKTINEINTRCLRTAVVYHGVKIGTDYHNFLLNCDIAINSQREGDYMNMAFPSKVISYLSHNLVVISTRIRSIEKSKLSNLITFSEDDKPASIVKSIQSIDFNNTTDNASQIQKLNDDFVNFLYRFLA